MLNLKGSTLYNHQADFITGNTPSLRRFFG
jgi:hypothetical protein